jgi:hypothetical protein
MSSRDWQTGSTISRATLLLSGLFSSALGLFVTAQQKPSGTEIEKRVYAGLQRRARQFTILMGASSVDIRLRGKYAPVSGKENR